MATEPFDPEHPLARAFAHLPPEVWARGYVDGMSALGSAVLGFGSRIRSTADQRAWVQHLLRCGADPEHPLQRNSRFDFGDRRLRNVAFRQFDTLLLDAALEAGMPLMPPASQMSNPPSLRDVLSHRRAEWVVASYRAARWPETAARHLPEMLDAWRQHPAEAETCTRVLLSEGAAFNAECLRPLILLTLTQPGGPWGKWFAQTRDACAPDGPPEGWREALGNDVVVLELLPSREAWQILDAAVPSEQKQAWAPQLPTRRWPGIPAARKSVRRGSPPRPPEAAERTLSAAQWAAVAALVHWACDWGIEPRSRTPEGLPWASWILRQSCRSLDDVYGVWCEKEGIELCAWSCLERLARSGVDMRLRCNRQALSGPAPGPSSIGSEAPVYGPQSVHRWLQPTNRPCLPSRMAHWPAAYARLCQAVGLDRQLAASNEKSPVPTRRSRM